MRLRPASRCGSSTSNERGGALAYLAACDVHRAKLFGRLEPTTGIVHGIVPFGRLVDQVMAKEPYRSAERVLLVVDNGSSHRGERAVRRQAALCPNLTLVHLPVHASWLNQIEIYLSIVQQGPFTEGLALPGRARSAHPRLPGPLRGDATPFEWKFTRRDLGKLLRRIAAHEHLAAAA